MIKKIFILIMLVLLFKNNIVYASTANAKYNYKHVIEIPATNIEDITSWANRKGFEIVHFLQILAQPIIIVIFIIFATMLLLGIFANPYLTGKGFMGLIMAVVIYALILYASLIMQLFTGWVSF